MKPLMLPAVDPLIRRALKRAGRCAYCGNKRELCKTSDRHCVFESRQWSRQRDQGRKLSLMAARLGRAS